MLLPELAADATVADRIEQLTDYALKAETIIEEQGQRIDGLKGALVCEERWRERLWDENKALKEERDANENCIRQFEHTLRVTAELNGDLWTMLVETLGVSLSCDSDGVEQARAAIKAVQEERDAALEQVEYYQEKLGGLTL